MVAKAARAMVGEFFSRIGWFLLLAGLILPGLQVFDRLTTNEALATVTEVRSTCQKQAASSAGNKRWRRIKCEEMADLEAAGTPVRATPFAKLAFTDARGRDRTAWARLSKLELTHAEVGQQLKILYRGNKKPYVAPRADWNSALVGFGISLSGLVLLGVGHAAKRAPSAPSPAPQRAPQTASGQGIWRRDRQDARQTTSAAYDTTRGHDTYRPAPSAQSNAGYANTTVAAARPGRAVQRNRGILERIFS